MCDALILVVAHPLTSARVPLSMISILQTDSLVRTALMPPIGLPAQPLSPVPLVLTTSAGMVHAEPLPQIVPQHRVARVANSNVPMVLAQDSHGKDVPVPAPLAHLTDLSSVSRTRLSVWRMCLYVLTHIKGARLAKFVPLAQEPPAKMVPAVRSLIVAQNSHALWRHLSGAPTATAPRIMRHAFSPTVAHGMLHTVADGKANV